MCRAVVSRLDVVVVAALVLARAACGAVQRLCRNAVPTNKGMFGRHAGVRVATKSFEPVAQGALGPGHLVGRLAHDHRVALAVVQRVQVLLEGQDVVEGNLALLVGHDFGVFVSFYFFHFFFFFGSCSASMDCLVLVRRLPVLVVDLTAIASLQETAGVHVSAKQVEAWSPVGK